MLNYHLFILSINSEVLLIIFYSKKAYEKAADLKVGGPKIYFSKSSTDVAVDYLPR